MNNGIQSFTSKMLMSVSMEHIRVMTVNVLTVLTLRGAIPVLASQASLEMENLAR